MSKYIVTAFIVLTAGFAQAHNLDVTDISTCNNKQFLVKLFQSHLSFDQQKALVLKSAKAVGMTPSDISFVGNNFTKGKEIIISLNPQRKVAAVGSRNEAARFSRFKNLVDEVNSKHEVSYAECNVNFDPNK
jgi:hypothetical protein